MPTGTESRFQNMTLLAEALEVNGVAMTLGGTAIVSLTAASGTADNTVADVGAAFSQTTLNNNFADVSAKINAILAALRTAGIIAT